MSETIRVERNTKETEISVSFEGPESLPGTISTEVPFFDHLLTSMAFHGELGFTISARGDIEVDPHHLVEDTGLVLGDAVRSYVLKKNAIERFGHAVIPMDDALVEVTIDAGGRPYFYMNALFPQSMCGNFDTALLKEFFRAFAVRGGLNLHIDARYGENSHHIAEAAFKALGKALGKALKEKAKGITPSTKGTISV
jgi:imidazoleglycerol-phosphate dehydratase